MKIDIGLAREEYMRACLRANDARCAALLSGTELAGAFYAQGTPDFALWCARMGYELTSETAAPVADGLPGIPSEEEQIRHNEAALRLISVPLGAVPGEQQATA